MKIYFYLIFAIIGLATLLSFLTLLKSRKFFEKIVAVDVITTITTGALIMFSIFFDAGFILDIAIIYAVLSFGAVIVVARYFEGGI